MMHIEYQVLETSRDRKVEPFQASLTTQEDLEEADSFGEFLKASLIALVLMVGLSATPYFPLFFLVTAPFGQFDS